jgi:glc operon protein GlcG
MNMDGLVLDLVQKLLQQAMDKAKSDFGRPICVAISDHAGEMLGFMKMDGAPLRSIQISQRKAYTSARMVVPTSVVSHKRLVLFLFALRKRGNVQPG